MIKRLFDFCLVLFASLFLLLPFLLVAVMVRVTSIGPVLYWSDRIGRYNNIFKMPKFRTMRVDTPAIATHLLPDPKQFLTPIGSFLRKSSLDELPQLWSIIHGDMSFVGPRPERPVFVDKFKEIIPDYTKRLAVKPGITGLAQVWHRYDETIEDVKKKIKYDLLYIKKYCLWTDLRILFRTFRVVFTGEGAR